MINRAAGRHRTRLSSRRPPSMLLESSGYNEQPGVYYLGGTAGWAGRRTFRIGSFDIGRAQGRRTVAIIILATLAVIVTTVIAGGSGPGHTSMARSSTPRGASSLPVPAVAPRPSATSGRPSARASAHPRHKVRSAPRGQVSEPGTAPSTVASPSPSMMASEPTIIATYIVAQQGLGEFQGEVQVVNDGTQPVADWQIVLVLPGDVVTSVSNASGSVSNGIVLLQPVSAAEVVPPSGALDVSFTALGLRTTPSVCAFNGIGCG